MPKDQHTHTVVCALKIHIYKYIYTAYQTHQLNLVLYDTFVYFAVAVGMASFVISAASQTYIVHILSAQ